MVASVVTERRRRRRRIAALLASGVVLGLSATTTLASWTDPEVATGTFAASIFGTESRSAGSPSWASNETAPGADLAFNATGLSPGVSRYAWLNLRTTSATDVGGNVQLTGAATDGDLVPALRYRAVRAAATGTDCDASAFNGSNTFIAGGAGEYLPVTSVPSPAANSPITVNGELRFCFEARIAAGASNDYQGDAGTVTWTFTSTSEE